MTDRLVWEAEIFRNLSIEMEKPIQADLVYLADSVPSHVPFECVCLDDSDGVGRSRL